MQEEQLSLFSVLSAVALGTPHEPEWVSEDHEGELDLVDDGDDRRRARHHPRPAAPTGSGRTRPRVVGWGRGGRVHHRTRREHKAHLRAENADWARDLARVTGMTHAQVNGELNRLSSVSKISEATVEQLERRLVAAEAWYRRL